MKKSLQLSKINFKYLYAIVKQIVNPKNHIFTLEHIYKYTT